MKSQDKIPTGKVARASKLFRASIKMSGNYVAHYTKRTFGRGDKDDLDRKNADEIFNVLSQLKGTALKIAQMLSMDTGILPKVYAEKLAASQNNAMRLSAPLVINTFRKYINQSPHDIYDEFNTIAVAAASIGQVHEAFKDGKRLAVKIQYPGVAESIQSDVNMVKPFVLRYMGVSSEVVQPYVEEIVDRLIDETDYRKELQNGLEAIAIAQRHERVVVPGFYPELSTDRILTMDWLEGTLLHDFFKEERSQEERNIIGQALVDFFWDQIHNYKKFHADLHSGNFLVTENLELGIIDFGCTKTLPSDFYHHYFSLVDEDVLNDRSKLKDIFIYLDFVRTTDTEEESKLYWEITNRSIEIISRPLRTDYFDFGDEQYNADLQAFGHDLSSNKSLKGDHAARGSKHAIYLHRAFLGLFGILYNLKAKVKFDKAFVKDLSI